MTQVSKKTVTKNGKETKLVRVPANLDPDFTNHQYIQNFKKNWKESCRKRFRRHQLRMKLVESFLDIMRPVPFDDHALVHESFNHVMNLLYPWVLDKEEEEIEPTEEED